MQVLASIRRRHIDDSSPAFVIRRRGLREIPLKLTSIFRLPSYGIVSAMPMHQSPCAIQGILYNCKIAATALTATTRLG
jgi:hypothetical protein